MVDTLVFHAQQAVKGGAECLLFGCAGIADQIREIEERVGVLCIPSVAAGVTQAIACLRQAAADGATPEETWKRICRMLAGRNVVLPK